MKKKHLITVILVTIGISAGVFLSSFFWFSEHFSVSRYFSHRNSNENLNITGHIKTEKGNILFVRIAHTPEQRRQGLSGFTQLPADQGMLFPFDTKGNYSFWMKEMLFPIDIIWLRQSAEYPGEYTIVHIAEQVKPETFPEHFTSPILANTVLEINSGMASVYNLDIGRKVWISFYE